MVACYGCPTAHERVEDYGLTTCVDKGIMNEKSNNVKVFGGLCNALAQAKRDLGNSLSRDLCITLSNVHCGLFGAPIRLW